MPNINSTFTVCGITTDANGNSKVRWTSDSIRRIKLFFKQGYVRADLVDLPQPMTKLQALDYIKTLPEFMNASDVATIAEAESYRMKVKQKADGTYVARPRGRPRKYPLGEVKVKSTKRGRPRLSLEVIAGRSTVASE